MITWPSFEDKLPLEGSDDAWTATFLGHDATRGFATYRVVLYTRGQVVAEPIMRLETRWIDDPSIVAVDRLRSNIAYHARCFLRPERGGWHSVVIDGIGYQWKLDEIELDYMAMSNRGLVGSGKYDVSIIAEIEYWFSFDVPSWGLDRPGWWLGPPHVTGFVVTRAIQIARRLGLKKLEDAHLREAFTPHRTVQDELDDASLALAALDREPWANDRFARCILAIGCSNFVADSEGARAIDDWVASHANDFDAALRRILSIQGDDEYMLRKCSAIAFLVELCARTNVELAVSQDALEAHGKTRKPILRPWGIPPTHAWWRAPSEA